MQRESAGYGTAVTVKVKEKNEMKNDMNNEKCK